MAITLLRFNSGDTDYVSKLNNDMATIEAAINSLQIAAGGAGQTFTIPILLDVLFRNTTGLIGVHSYEPTISGTSLNISAGGAYLASAQSVVQGIPTTMAFDGQPADTYYLVPDTTGGLQRKTTGTDAVWSVVWTGSGFGTITRVAQALFDIDEGDDSRISAALATSFATLDARLEAGESLIKVVQDTANEALGAVGPRVRKVGCTVSATGIAGAIQIDFYGTITGWTVVADAVGALTVEVDRKASSPPPAAPAIPNTTTDKISASAPITLAAAQSASNTSVTGWNVSVMPWDVLQFNVTTLTTLTRATLYLWIDEITSP